MSKGYQKSLFAIYGDEIVYEGLPFAIINPRCNYTQRADAEQELREHSDWDAMQEEHEKEIAAEYDRGYTEAEGDARQRAGQIAARIRNHLDGLLGNDESDDAIAVENLLTELETL